MRTKVDHGLQGERASAELPGLWLFRPAALLTVEGARHGVALTAGNACVDDIVADYLINLELPAEGARCTL